ncbi:hypothetical protein K470DRAFT_277889 [Piedraia hortae CBS 480.64]|uniref:TPR-like protein n=1 Tax=Piedraia hortae CBS 480.64 TaxID=1314780 RepID=A0A6A7BV14_9PEZI|nr:hypothetical protein K470DRAFT_277889 [Piedraia hortae CBS 480.64]
MAFSSPSKRLPTATPGTFWPTHMELQDHQPLLRKLRELGFDNPDPEEMKIEITLHEDLYHKFITRYGADHPLVHIVSTTLGFIFMYLGELQSAYYLLLEVRNALWAKTARDNAAILELNQHLGKIMLELNLTDDADDCVNLAWSGYMSVFPASNIMVLETAQAMGEIYLEQDEPKQATDMFEAALIGMTTTLGGTHLHTIRVLYDIGVMHLDRNELSAAKDKMTLALSRAKRALKPCSFLIYKLYLQLAFIYLAMGQSEAGKDYVKDALKQSGEVFSHDNSFLRGLLEFLGGEGGLLDAVNKSNQKNFKEKHAKDRQEQSSFCRRDLNRRYEYCDSSGPL